MYLCIQLVKVIIFIYVVMEFCMHLDFNANVNDPDVNVFKYVVLYVS